ncbi:activator of Hsp90 ATPase 1 family protein [Actinosynnema sp. ALI-1.44]|nr:activator of Hsp90 ATPase 1 family protein [Actinosynnema sp. ALI-1.44]
MRQSQVGLTKDAGWQIGVSKTVDHPAPAVWAFLTSPEGIAIWLGEGVTVLSDLGAGYETKGGVRGETRSFHNHGRLRLTWQPKDWKHETTLQLTVTPVGEGRARLGVHQERLADAAERDQQRRHWQGVVAALVEALPGGTVT